jgi:hypothetical protein
MFDHMLEEDRNRHTQQVREILSESSHEVKRNKCRTEQEVMNLACLIDKDAYAEFEKRIFEAAALFDNNFAFDYNGPWAPHNFVNINIEL